MSWLAFFIAWFMMQSSTAVNDAWWDQYLEKLVGVHQVLFSLSWLVWVIFILGIAIAAFVLFVMIKDNDRRLSGCSLGCGCFPLIVLLALPLVAWINLLLAQGMANSFGPNGITNTGNFIVSLVLLIILGLG